MDCSPPGSSIHQIFQARILGWVAISFSSGSSHQGSNPDLPHCRQILYHLSHPWDYDQGKNHHDCSLLLHPPRTLDSQIPGPHTSGTRLRCPACSSLVPEVSSVPHQWHQFHQWSLWPAKPTWTAPLSCLWVITHSCAHLLSPIPPLHPPGLPSGPSRFFHSQALVLQTSGLISQSYLIFTLRSTFSVRPSMTMHTLQYCISCQAPSSTGTPWSPPQLPVSP